MLYVLKCCYPYKLYHFLSAYLGQGKVRDFLDFLFLHLPHLPSHIVFCDNCYPAFYLVLNHPTFNQIKKKHGINYSDKFYIRLLYAVSFVLSY